MRNIIVTVTDKYNRFAYDVEVPVDQPGMKVTEDVLEVLNECSPELNLNALYHCLHLSRLDRYLKDEETLAQAGVWNGDYITVIPRLWR